MKQEIREIELLAPARDAHVAIEAINHGADAVYMGATSFGARAQAGNSIDDVARVCDYAHQYNAHIYATVNTIVYDNELKQVERLVHSLYRVGVDALIIQDMGLLRLDLPPIALHASTQCDIRTPKKARFLEAAGCSQLVLARELSLDEINAIHSAVKVPLEAFVHGALCVCYSGRCQASYAFKGRSANRGECAQLCRLPYDLEDSNGHKIISNKHLLSLRDLNQSDRVKAMIDAGVSSFKIEGRLKDVGYVKNVVAYYRQVLDGIIAGSGRNLKRSSFGMSSFTFEPRLERSFNRSFTNYFLDGHPAPQSLTMASLDTPKSLGEPLGRVREVRGTILRLESGLAISNGDGLSFMGADGLFSGVRINEVHGNDIVLNSSTPIKRGTMVYRTFDKQFNDVLSKPSAHRRIGVDVSLRIVGNLLCIDAIDERGCQVTHSMEVPTLEKSRSPQTERQRAELAKLGNTIYILNEAKLLGEYFIPASVLSQLRHEMVEYLDRAWRIIRPVEMRRPELHDVKYFTNVLTSADNVANHLACEFYKSHGVEKIESAIEVRPRNDGVVMTTRYCLRRELGACRRAADARKLPESLFLHSGNVLMRVECDCAKCEMRLSLV